MAETWVIKSSATGALATTQISFTSNGQKFTSIGANDSSGVAMILYYDSYEAAGYDLGWGVYEFEIDAYRKLTFDTPPTGALLTWLQSNAVKQPNDTAVQDTKALTITSNGTVSVTPDAPYDGLSSVDVTVDVSGSGGGVIRGLTLGSGYFNIHTDNVSFIGCDFMNINIQFIYGSTNISFTNCNFADSTIICEQSIRDAIENGSGNYVNNVQFDIMT